MSAVKSGLGDRWDIISYCLGFSLILFGLKLQLIHAFGNATPFWDQWDAEAAFLYIPYLESTYRWSDLVTPHNEHRILLTRLLALFLLEINDVWNPLLQMVVNAVLHISAVLLCNLLLTSIVGKKWLLHLLLFSLVIFGLPFGWENTLAGFQSQFYFVLIFSIACIWITVLNNPLSPVWWSGIVTGVLAFFSLASGIFAIAAGFFACLCILVTRKEMKLKSLIALAVMLSLFITGYKLTPVVEGHAMLKADSVLQFFHAFTSILGWPLSSNRFYAGIFAFMGLAAFTNIISVMIMYMPSIIFSVFFLRNKPPASDKGWFILALIVWCITQVAGIAYGRADMMLSSRYLDLFAFGILLNLSCMIWLISFHNSFSTKKIWGIALAWIGLVLSSMMVTTFDNARLQLVSKHDAGVVQENNVKNYLLTYDDSFLKDKPLFDIPYPDANRLTLLLNSPELQNILPANLRSPSTRNVGRFDNMVDYLLVNWAVILVAGIFIMVLIMFQARIK